jgi:RNA polymerase sigma factor (sigma-70 family)
MPATRVRLLDMQQAMSDDLRPITPDVLSVLVDNHRAFLAFLQKRTGDRAMAEDVLQEAFAKAITSGSELRDDEAATAWFYRMLRNALVDHYRRRASRSKAQEAAAREIETTVEPDAESLSAVCQCVAQLAGTLKPELAKAIERVDVEGASIQAYADELGITPNNARVRLHRARAALRERVKQSCGTCADHGCLDCTCAHAPGAKKSCCHE